MEFDPAKFQAALGAGQALAGIFTRPKRPTYNIPGAAQEATALARREAAATTRPGNDQALADIRRSTTNTVGRAKSVSKSASQILNASAQANAVEQGAIQRNNAMNTQYGLNARQNLFGALNTMAGYQDKAFQMNKFQPYMQKAETKAALISSGLQNLYGAGNTYAEKAMFDKYFGGQQQQGGGSVNSGAATSSGQASPFNNDFMKYGRGPQ